MKCPKCQAPGYLYKRHGFWQCPATACGHSWFADPEPVAESAEPFPGMFPSASARPGWELRSREEQAQLEARQRRGREITAAASHAANAMADFKRLHPDADFAVRVDAWFRAGCVLADEIPMEVQDA